MLIFAAVFDQAAAQSTPPASERGHPIQYAQAQSAQESKPPPKMVSSGKVEIDQYQVAFIGSGNLGGGKLHYQGKVYPFSIGGLGIGGIGISKIEAVGEVYNLFDLSLFPGVYGQARTGYALTDLGGGKFWIENPAGVYIKLEAKRQGLALSLGADAIYIQMKE